MGVGITSGQINLKWVTGNASTCKLIGKKQFTKAKRKDVKIVQVATAVAAAVVVCLLFSVYLPVLSAFVWGRVGCGQAIGLD